MTTGQVVVLIWFCGSVVLSVISNVAFNFWLRARGVRARFGLGGLPGHLDGLYAEWCRNHGRSPRQVLMLRRLSYVNLVLAIIFAAPLLAGR